MAETDPQESGIDQYFDIGPDGPPMWALVIGAVIVGAAILAGFYGLYIINRAASPTPSPDSLTLTQAAAAVQTPVPDEATITPSVRPTTITVTPSPTATVTATAEPPTYTVSQGDSLIAIALRLNVNADTLAALNRISGETIYPGQVLLVPPTVTPWPETGPFPHAVSQGETLLSIAALYSVTVDGIKSLNGLTSDAIFVGQRVLIPVGGIRPHTPTPSPTPWQAAIITGELDLAYSLSTATERFVLHIPPDTRAADDDETARIAQLVEDALDYSQGILQERLSGRFDVYVADTLFDAPYTSRRSYSLPDKNQLWLLYDGSGSPTEQLYFVTYALTHLVATRTLGEAASPLLGEGLAVYAGGEVLVSETAQGHAYLSLLQFCAAYQTAGSLPRVSRELTFGGHLGHLDQYLAAGCFAGYLIETEGADKFTQVYLDGDYGAFYERSLVQLESEWISSLREVAGDLPFDPEELVRVATVIDEAYLGLWADFEGTTGEFAAYEQLDRARLALLQRRLAAAQYHLEMFETLQSDNKTD